MKTIFRHLPLLLILSLAFGLLCLPSAFAADYATPTEIEEVSSSVAYTGEYYKVSTPADEENTLYVEGKTSTAVKMLCIELRKSAADDTNGTCVIRAFAVPDSTGAFSLKIDTTAGSYAAPEAVNGVGTAMTAKDSYDTMPGYLPVPQMTTGLYRLTITGATTDDDAAIGSGSQWWTGPLGGSSGYLWKGAVFSVFSDSSNDPRLVQFDAVLSARSVQHAAVEGAASDVIDSYPGSWERYLDPDISDIEYVLEDPSTGEHAELTDEQMAYIASVAQEITAGVTDNYTRLLKLYEYVSANFYYDHYALEAGASIQYCNPYYNLYALRTGYSVPNSSDGKIATVCDGYSAMIIAMARSLGIPARMVNGYSLSGSAYNATWATKTPGTTSNHWWVEAYVGGRWVMLDATRGSLNSWTRSSASDAGTWSKNSLISYAGFDISNAVISGSYLVREVEGGSSEGIYLCYEDEVSKLRAFLNTPDDSGATNGSKLGGEYDPDDISTWFTAEKAGFFTDGYGRVHEIIANSKTLVGDADFSGFSSLEYLTIFTNDLTSLNLDGCSDLVYLSAGYNDFTSFDSSDSPALATLHLPSAPLQSASFCHGSSVITITGEGGTFSFDYDADNETPLTIYAGTAPEGMVFRGVYDSSGALVTDKSGTAFLPEDTSYTVLFEDNTAERLPAPVVTADNDPQSGNIRLTWEAVEGADKYTIYRSDSETGTFTAWYTQANTSYTNTSSPLGQTYYFKVKAVNETDDTKSSVSSNIVSIFRVLARPSLTTYVDDVTGKIVLNWSAIANAAAYDIYRSESQTEGYTLIASYTPSSSETALSYADESGVAGTLYYYKVVSTHADSSLNSADSSIGWQRCKCAQPVVTGSVNADGKPTLTWSLVDGAEKYAVYRAENDSDTPTWYASSTTGSYTDKAAVAGTTYYYTVRAIAGESYSAHSEKISLTASDMVDNENRISAPVVTADNAPWSGAIRLTWEAVEGADKYTVYRSDSETGPFTAWSNPTNPTYISSTFDPGTTYYYKVRAICSDDDTRSSVYSDVLRGTQVLARTSLTTSVDDASGKIVLSWTAVSGAAAYDIYRATAEAGEYSLIQSVTDLTHTDTTGVPGTTYYYKVVATHTDSTLNAAASSIGWQPCKCAQPVVTGSTDAAGKPVLTWPLVDGAEKYAVYRAENESDTPTWHASSTTGSYTDTSAAAGATYYYTVRAIVGENYSAHSEKIAVTASDMVDNENRISAPVVTAGNSPWSGAIRLTWEAVEGADKYTVYRCATETGTYTAWHTLTGTTYTSGTLSLGETYYYKVRAICSEDDTRSSVYSAVVPGTQVLPCTSLTTSVDDASGKIVLSWTAVSGATGYDVYRATAQDGDYSCIDSVTALTYTDTAGVPGTAYYYKVVATHTDSALNAAASSIGWQRCKCAQPVVTGSTNAGGKPNLTWPLVDGAEKYAVYRAENSSDTPTWYASSTTGSYTDKAAVAGSTYYYTVRAIVGENYSAHSEKIAVTCAQPPAVVAPVISISCDAASGKPVLTWSEVPGAAKYEVWRAYSQNGTYYKMGTTSTTTYTNTGAVANTTYYYKVRSLGEDGSTSDFSTAKNMTCDCARPVVSISCVAASGKPRLTWDAVDGAVKYEVWRAYSKNGTYYKMGTTTSTSYTNTSAAANTTYYYKVYAIGSSSYAKSAASAVVNMTCDCAQPVVSISCVAASGKPRLSWTAVDGAVKYEVWRSTSKNGTYYKQGTTTGTTYTNTGAKANTTYYYKVYAVGSSSYAKSAASTVKNMTCDCARPTVTLSLSSAGKPRLSWTAVDGAVKYEVWRAYSETGTYYKMGTTTNTTYTNTGAVSGTTYYYKVYAIGSSSYAKSAASTPQYITCK